MPADAKKPAHGGSLSLALDFGPLLVFFLSYKGAGWFWGAGNPITAMSFGTAAFMGVGAYSCYKLTTFFPGVNIIVLILVSGLFSAGIVFVIASVAGLVFEYYMGPEKH